MKGFRSFLALAAIALFACAFLGGCAGTGGILGCGDGSQPFIKLQMPLAVGVQQVPTELPPARQVSVFAAPVQAVAAAPAFAAAPACPVPQPSYPDVDPVFNAPRKRSYFVEK